jgi:hypothetical protein
VTPDKARRPRLDLREALIQGVIASTTHESESNHWSYGVMRELISDAPEIAWPVLLEIIDRAPEEALGYVAAGPLEDLIGEHGFEIIDAIETEAGRNPRLRKTLVGVWQGLTVESIWTRIQALIDDDSRGEWGAYEPKGYDRHVEWQVMGRPPSVVGSTDPEQVERRGRLLAALRAAVPPEFRPFTTPVYVRIRIEPGPSTDPSASVVEAVAAITETLSTDRLAELAGPEFQGVGAFTSRLLVREVSAFDIVSHEPSYILKVLLMGEEQVKSLTDLDLLDEFEASLPTDAESARQQIANMYAEFGDEITPELRQRLRSQGIELPE